jgi:hypothetical protein
MQATATTALTPLGLPCYQKAIIAAKKTYEHHGLDKYNSYIVEQVLRELHMKTQRLNNDERPWRCTVQFAPG